MRYAMQCHGSRDGEWDNMHEGAAAKVWRPRNTAVEAIAKCMAWTGFIYIPAMQVVDLTTGDVVWRRASEYDVGAGAPIEHEHEALARDAAKRILSGAPEEEATSPQEALF